LDIDESLVRVQVMLPEKWLAKLKETAFEKEVSRGSLIREALRDWFKKIEESTQPNPKAKISDEDLDDILNHCSTFFGGFEIDGEDGFIATMKLNNFKLKDLTPEQWETVKEKIQLGYNGYFSPPTPEEFAEKFEVLEPSEEQLEWLSAGTAETEEE
jgi:hypothetical protein